MKRFDVGNNIYSFMIQCFWFVLVAFLVSLCSIPSLLCYGEEHEITSLQGKQFYPLTTVRGLHEHSPKIVVYRHVTGGFANNMMGLVTSYVFSMLMNAVGYSLTRPFHLSNS